MRVSVAQKDSKTDCAQQQANRRDIFFGMLALLPGMLGLWVALTLFLPDAQKSSDADAYGTVLRAFAFGALFFGYAIYRFYRIYRRKQTHRPITSR